MSTTNFPAARPIKDSTGKVILPVTHADNVIDGVNRNSPKFFGSIFLNGIEVLKTQSGGEGGGTEVLPMDPSMGGTGFDNLTDLANEIARLLGYTSGGSQGVIPITKGGTGATTAAAALTALGAASAAYFTASVNTSWSGNATDGYTKTITVTGIRSTDVPVVGVILSSEKDTAILQSRAFANINRITTATNSITLYAYRSQPTTAINIQLLVVRGF